VALAPLAKLGEDLQHGRNDRSCRSGITRGRVFSHICVQYTFRVRKQKVERSALRCAIAAEIHANMSIVMHHIESFWYAIDEGAEHIPYHQVVVHRSVFEAMRGNFGLIESNQLAQIIYLYARLEYIISQHNTLLGYLKHEGPLEVGGYPTHRINLHASAQELTKDASALVAALRKGVNQSWTIRHRSLGP